MPQSKSLYETMEDSFELLDPYQKAKFLGDRLTWVAGSDLCNEVRIRICDKSL